MIDVQYVVSRINDEGPIIPHGFEWLSNDDSKSDLEDEEMQAQQIQDIIKAVVPFAEVFKNSLSYLNQWDGVQERRLAFQKKATYLRQQLQDICKQQLGDGSEHSDSLSNNDNENKDDIDINLDTGDEQDRCTQVVEGYSGTGCPVFTISWVFILLES